MIAESSRVLFALLLVASLAAGCRKHEPAPGTGSATGTAPLDQSGVSSSAPLRPEGQARWLPPHRRLLVRMPAT